MDPIDDNAEEANDSTNAADDEIETVDDNTPETDNAEEASDSTNAADDEIETIDDNAPENDTTSPRNVSDLYDDDEDTPVEALKEEPQQQTESASDKKDNDTNDAKSDKSDSTDEVDHDDEPQPKAKAKAKAKEEAQEDETRGQEEINRISVDEVAEDKGWRKKKKNIELKPSSIRLTRLSDEVLDEIPQKFVKPNGYNEFLAKATNATDHYIFFVMGLPASGKASTAISLAAQLAENSVTPLDIFLYMGGDKSLVDIASDPNLPRNAIIIIKDVFEQKIRPDEFSYSTSFGYEDTLTSLNIRIIFTASTQTAENVPPEIIRFPAITTEYSAISLGRIYIKHMNVYFPKIDHNKEQRKRLKEIAKPVIEGLPQPVRPVNINTLFEKFSQNPQRMFEEIKPDSLRQQAARLWFNNLKWNYRLYTMLVVLFKNIPFTMLDDIYEMSVELLRHSGMDGGVQFIDSRRIGSQDMFDRIDVRRDGNYLQFNNEQFEKEAHAQIENNYRLLWSLCETFVTIIKEKLDENNDELRDLLAQTLAQVGSYQPEKLLRHLVGLAGDSRPFVAMSVAVAIGHLARDMQHYEFIQKTLTSWQEANEPDLFWVTAASIWKVYEVIARDYGNLHDFAAKEISTLGTTRTETARTNRPMDMLRALQTLLTKLAENCKTIAPGFTENIRKQLTAEFQKNVDSSEEIQADPDLKRAAMNYIPQRVKEEIALLQTALASQNQTVLIGAVARIAEKQPTDMVELVNEWMSGDDNELALWQVGYTMINRLFEETKSPVWIKAPLLETRCFPLLELLSTILKTTVMQVEKPSYGMLRNVLDTLLHGDALAARGIGRSQREITGLAVESPINSALTAIEMWYEIAIGVAKLPNETKPSDEHDLTAETPDDEESTPRSRQLDKVTLRKRRELWDNAVGPQMLRIVNEATPAGRTLLRNALLQKWSDSAHDVVRILAHSLMARSHVLDGLVMDLPVKDRSGILVLDSRNVNEKYISSVFQLAQYLSVLSPLEIYHLGHRQEPIIWGIRDHTAVSSQDLWLPRPKPGLLMPIVDALTTKEVPLDPARCHFIAVLNIQPVTDCDDLFDELHEANKTAPIVGGNALAQIRARKAAATSPQQYKWQWNNKFLIVSRQPLPNGVTRLNLQLDNLTDSLNTLQIYLSKQIANTLRVLPVGQRWKDLNLYDVAPEPVTAENVSENLEIWVQQLDDINYTHPRRDTALTIGWSIITLSLENLPGAIEIVTRWLTPKKDEVGGQFKRQMGAACIRLLFNFYNADDNPQPETTGELLHLFPPFLESHPGYLEFVDVLHIVLGWARRDTWLDALINNEQDYFLEALGSIKQKRDVNQLFALIDRYKHLCQTVTFYLKLGYSWARFVEILSTVYAWREAMQEYKKKTRRKPPTLPSTISDTIADELNHFFGLPQAEQQWILGEISSRTDVFGASTTRDGALNEYKNLDTVVEAMRSRLQLQSQGKLPPLMGDGKYALVLIDIPVDKKVRGRVRDLSLNLLSAIRSYTQPVFDEALDEETEAQLRLRYGTNLTFTVHQLGKRQLLSKKAKIKAGELFTADSIAPAPLIGPILDRYSPEQVSCIIIVTASLIYDYDDWISDDQWREKFWMYKAGHWQPSWGNVYRLESSKWPDIDELKFDIEKIILNSVSQKERP